MKTPIRLLATQSLCLIALAIFFVVRSEAQDPFSPDENAGEATAQELGDNSAAKGAKDSSGRPPEQVERSAVVLSIRANPPRTPAELARAVQLLARIRRWDEVGRWLDEAAKLGLNETNATQMVQAAGVQTFVQLSGLESGLSDLRKSNAQKILDLASAAVNNPKRLVEAVAKLRSPIKAERMQGYRSLESAGNRGVAALINHFLDDTASKPAPAMCEAFALMGKSAFGAWQAAMTTSNAIARGKLALLAVRAGDASLTMQLCIAANDVRVDQTVREELATIAAAKGKSIPKTQTVHRHAIDQMQKSLTAFQKIRWEDEPDAYMTWQLSSDEKTVSEKTARLADLDWVRAVQCAHSVIQCGATEDIQSGLALAILCEQACLSAADAANVTLASVAPNMPTTMHDSYEFGCLVWDAAEKNGLASAQRIAVQNLGRWANEEGTIPNPVLERLSAACFSGHGPVRYTAAQALLDSMVRRREDGSVQLSDIHFDGRNRLEKVLLEMRLLEGSPLALVVGGAVDLRTHTKTFLESFGYRVQEATSATQTMSLLREGLPIEAVFIVSPVLEMNLGDLTQRIRAHPGTAACPIAILAASLSRGEHEIAASDVRVVMGSVPPEPTEFADILRRMRIVTQSPKIDASLRNTWREVSTSYWNERQSKLVASQAKGVGSTAIDTPLGQLHLIRMAADKSVAMPKREQASQNFVQSVKQFGVLLSSETVKAQYDEYNKRGPDEPDLRIALGRILDAIEAAKGDRPWDEVAP